MFSVHLGPKVVCVHSTPHHLRSVVPTPRQNTLVRATQAGWGNRWPRPYNTVWAAPAQPAAFHCVSDWFLMACKQCRGPDLCIDPQPFSSLVLPEGRSASQEEDKKEEGPDQGLICARGPGRGLPPTWPGPLGWPFPCVWVDGSDGAASVPLFPAAMRCFAEGRDETCAVDHP